MIPIIEDAILGSELDCQFYNLVNVGAITPTPPNLAASDDPRLTDPRLPAAGSVTNVHVANAAAIDQSKLNLNGLLPTAWLGTTNLTAAQGNLVEYLSNKNMPNGYAGLNASGKVPAAQLPATAGTGTVTSVALTMPAPFVVGGSPVTGAGTFAVTWGTVPDLTWFGNKSGAAAAPQFYTTPLPPALIPSLDASKVTSGTFSPARLPPAITLGTSHAPGAVPDPGDGSGAALASDYLARDLSYKPVPAIGPIYQPTLPAPTLAFTPGSGLPITVVPSSIVDGVIFFYSFTSAVTGFSEFPPEGYVSLVFGSTIWVYAAHAGYNNSPMSTHANV
jgi:hypothetical protein